MPEKAVQTAEFAEAERQVPRYQPADVGAPNHNDLRPVMRNCSDQKRGEAA